MNTFNLSVLHSSVINEYKMLPSHIVLSQSSWGSKQSKNVLGLTLSKASTGSSDVLDLLVDTVLQDNYPIIHRFLVILKEAVKQQKPCFNKSILNDLLKEIWNDARQSEVDVESKTILKKILIKVQENASSNIGRNICLTSINCITLDIVYSSLTS